MIYEAAMEYHKLCDAYDEEHPHPEQRASWTKNAHRVKDSLLKAINIALDIQEPRDQVTPSEWLRAIQQISGELSRSKAQEERQQLQFVTPKKNDE